MKRSKQLSKSSLRNEKETTSAIRIQRAFYIKLGRGGKWEADSLARNIMRIGWGNNSVADMNSRNWAVIKRQLRAEKKDQGAVTRDLNALIEIVTSSEEDVWITFHASRLWWCRLAPGPVEQDEISKFRRVAGTWSDRDLGGRVLLTSDIPGELSKVQGFRGTACAVRQIDRLSRLLNAERSLPYQAVKNARDLLIKETQAALRELHWKDFETLVDLVFRQAGWRRLSKLGETMKYADLELEEPVTGERYQVQVKSSADVRDFCTYRDQFARQGFRKLFFVVHTPSTSLSQQQSSPSVELVLPSRLSAMVIDSGLVLWILAKIR